MRTNSILCRENRSRAEGDRACRRSWRIPVHLWPLPPILGGPGVTQILTEDAKGYFGGYFFIEEDPRATADKMEAVILERRAALHI